MTKVTSFDGATARHMGHKAAEALKALAAEHGLEVRYSGGSFESTRFTMKVELRVADPKVTLDAGKAKWERFAPVFGMPASAFGKSFIQGGDTWMITGILPNRPKFCVQAKNIFTGKEMLFPAHFARSAA